MVKAIRIDVSSPDQKQEFGKSLALMSEMGWEIARDDHERTLVSVKGESEPRATSSWREPSEQAELVEVKHASILQDLGLAGLESALANSVSVGHGVDRVVIGFNWTLVRSGDLCGIARSPARGTEGARTIRPPEGFTGRELSDLAQFMTSADPLERSLGLAAINCFWNRREPLKEAEPYLAERGGLASIEAPGDGAIIIGGFRGALKRLPKARIVEREPKPGDIPADQAAEHFKTARSLSITAQTLMNGSLAPLLSTSQMVPFRNLVGPSCPACPLLFDHGLDEVFGAVILDPEAAEKFILESGTMIMLDHIATTRTLRAT